MVSVAMGVCRQLASRGFVVFLTARDARKAETAARKLADVGTVEPLRLDVADARSLQSAATEVASRYGYLDILINNGGIHYDTWETVEYAAINGTVMETITTNLLGPVAHVPGVPAAAAEELVEKALEDAAIANSQENGHAAQQTAVQVRPALTHQASPSWRECCSLVPGGGIEPP